MLTLILFAGSRRSSSLLQSATHPRPKCPLHLNLPLFGRQPCMREAIGHLMHGPSLTGLAPVHMCCGVHMCRRACSSFNGRRLHVLRRLPSCTVYCAAIVLSLSCTSRVSKRCEFAVHLWWSGADVESSLTTRRLPKPVMHQVQDEENTRRGESGQQLRRTAA